MPLLRAANNGISAAVDARGRILDALAINARDTIDLSIPVASVSDVVSTGQRRVNGYLIMLALALIAFVFSVRHKLPAN